MRKSGVKADDKRCSAAGRLSSGLVKPPVRRSGIPTVNQKKGPLSVLPTGASTVPRKRQSSSMGSAFYGSNRMSNAEMSKKDTRPIHEKSFQQKCATKLIKFLESQDYPHAVNTRTLMTPQSKDFLRIFEFLFKFLDPAFALTTRVEEEIPRAMKSVFYPFAITKSHLLNIGARHSWPFLLAALDWLRQLIEMTIDYDCDADVEAFQSTEVSDDKGFVDFCEKAYRAYMAGNDDWPELEKEAEDLLVGDAIRATKALTEPCNQLLAELEVLKATENKSEQAKMALYNLNGDFTKFTAYKKDVEAHIDRKRKEKTLLEDQHKVLQEELNSILEDNRQKKAICTSQPMTPKEAEDLRRDCSEFKQQGISVENFIKEINNQIWSEEKNISFLKEKVISESTRYNSKAQANQFIPASAQNAQGHNYEVNAGFNVNSEDFSKVEFLQGQALKQLKESNRSRKLDLIKEEECHEKLTELSKETSEEVTESKQSIKNIEKELNFRKEDGSKEISKLQEEIKKIERKDKLSSRDVEVEEAEQELSDLKQRLASITAARERRTSQLQQDFNETAEVVKKYKIKYGNDVIRPLIRRFGNLSTVD